MQEKDTFEKKNLFSGQRLILALVVIAGGFFLWNDHRAHVLGALPYLILFLCPIMHLFMHNSHDRSHDHQNHGK